MGIKDLFRPSPALIDAAGNTALQLASPWADDSHLATVTAAEIIGLKSDTVVTRNLAMKVPAIAKGRALIAGTLSRFPLQKLKDSTPVAPDIWMYRSDTGQDPHQRMLWTIDDLIFYGKSLWLLKRTSKGDVSDAMRCPYGMWEIDPDGYIIVDRKRVNSEDVCLIPGPQEGLLELASNTIRGAIALENAWIQRATSPVPLVELKITDANMELTREEKQALANDWESQRKKGGTAVLPYGLDLKTHGDTDTDLFVQGRNALRLDVANYLNVPSNLLEGSYSTASLTYSTTETKRNELLDYSLSFWSGAIEARLSQDDMVPRGSAVQFDLSWLQNNQADDVNPPQRRD